MDDLPDMDAQMRGLAEDTARLREQFIRADLETCSTSLEMAKLEMSSGNTPLAMQELALIEKGIKTIERFLPETPAGARPELEGMLAKLKAEVQSWKREVGKE